MRILLLTHAFNSLTQRLFVALKDDGHAVSIEFDIHDEVSMEAVDMFAPDLIVAPFLKRAIPESIWQHHPCFIVHPGIIGDRGPSALDWAVFNDEKQWGVTVLQANAEMDAGDIWASVNFEMRDASKSSLYRTEVSQAALEAVQLAVTRFASGDFVPTPLHESTSKIQGECRDLLTQDDRKIDWFHDSSATVMRKIRSADGFPGIKDELFGREVFLYDVHLAEGINGACGEVIARSGPAICRATQDGAVWIGHIKDKQNKHPFKLPAAILFADQVEGLLEVAPEQGGYQEIWYEEEADVGYLHFCFYNGAMSSEQCERLLEAYQQALLCPTKVLVMMGGQDFWSNGMHLNMIEAATSAADESWRNINAMNDVAEAMINTTSHYVIAAMQGNAGAGGVLLARAADQVWAHHSVILNPHYKDMGNLFGSEYWTYLLPRYAGKQHAERIAAARLPMGVQEGKTLGLIDHILTEDKGSLINQIKYNAQTLAGRTDLPLMISDKTKQRLEDEQNKPLASYRQEELEKMRRNFYGFDPSYHVARYNFVYKVCKSRTPLTLAAHRNVKSKHVMTFAGGIEKQARSAA